MQIICKTESQLALFFLPLGFRVGALFYEEVSGSLGA